jgi:cytochrome c biogenesis protein CcmG/thiol:disulfide interchange protein DsbE
LSSNEWIVVSTTMYKRSAAKPLDFLNFDNLFYGTSFVWRSSKHNSMKRFALICSVAFLLMAFVPGGRQLPSVDIKDLNGAPFNTSKIENDGNPIIISFWATWCSPCKRELNTIADEYEDWIDETGVKLIAVSIDDSRNVQKVKPYVNGQAWEYEVLLDPNGDFKRAMNVNNVPHTFLLNGNREIVWQHNSYSPGDEEELYELVNKLANGESIE